MPEIITYSLGIDNPLQANPKWDKAFDVISKFNGNTDYGKKILADAAQMNFIWGKSKLRVE